MGVEMTGGGTALPVNYEYSFIGIVCAYGKEPGTVIVKRPDKGDRTTKELRVLSRCTNKTKDWWMPDIDEQVICFLMPNTSGKGPGEGFVACAMYSKEDPPVETSNNVRSIHYKDGSFIRIDMDAGKIEIHASAGHRGSVSHGSRGEACFPRVLEAGQNQRGEQVLYSNGEDNQMHGKTPLDGIQ